MDIHQKHYPLLEIDNRGEEIIQIWQHGHGDGEINVNIIERDKIPALIELLQKEIKTV